MPLSQYKWSENKAFTVARAVVRDYRKGKVWVRVILDTTSNLCVTWGSADQGATWVQVAA